MSGPKLGPSPTYLGFTRDRTPKLRKSAIADLRWLASLAPQGDGLRGSLGWSRRRAERGVKVDARAFADAHVSHRAAMTGNLPVQMERSRTRHSINQGTISRVGSRAGFCLWMTQSG